MGLIARLKRITCGRIKVFLDSAEDADAVSRVLLRELDEYQELVAGAEAKARTASLSSQCRVDMTEGRFARLGRGAELAVKRGDDETARLLLEEQVRVERQLLDERSALTTAQKAMNDVLDVRASLDESLHYLRVRHHERLGVMPGGGFRKSDSGQASAGILDQVARIEAEVPGHACGFRKLPGASSDMIERHLQRLEREVEIEERMNRMRKTVKGHVRLRAVVRRRRKASG